MSIVSRLLGGRNGKASKPESVAAAPGEVRPPAPREETLDETPRLRDIVDARLAYHLFLGRAPESDEVAEAMIGRSLPDTARSFLASSEFTGRILEPVAQSGAPSEWQGGLPLDFAERPLLASLAIDREPLTAAAGWAESLGCLFRSPVPRATLIAVHGDAAAPLLAATDIAYETLLARKTQRAAALAHLAACTRGLRITAVHDILLDEAGVARSITDDPSITADIAWPAGDRPRLFALRLRLRHSEPGPLAAKLYIDFGRGFSEAATLVALADGRSDILFFVVANDGLCRLRIDPVDASARFRLEDIAFAPVPHRAAVEALIRERSRDAIDSFYWIRAMSPALDRLEAEPPDDATALRLSHDLTFSPTGGSYADWVQRYERPTAADYQRMEAMIAGFRHRPTFSFVMPTYNTPLDLLEQCVNSMLSQNYPDFTICIADDHSPDRRVADFLADLAVRDPRVRFVRRPTNGHISEASNTALALAEGDYVVLIDHDDIVPDYCLFVLAEAINRHPDAKLLYSDEDKIDADDARCQPYFKGGLNMTLLCGHNMISHLGVYRTELVRAVGGFRKGFEGSQDYDLALRCLDAIRPEDVVYVPHVLYHWRMIAGSTAVAIEEKGYAANAALDAITAHCGRVELPFRARPGVAPGISSLELTEVPDLSVSILIPTRDGLELLRPCIDSIVRNRGGRCEIVVVDNGSTHPEALDYLATLERDGIALVVRWDEPFNFSAINNIGVEHCSGDIICFLNNDTEVISAQWLDRARAFLSRAEIGAVGARLLYPDGMLQHFGIVLGMGAHRIAGTPHGGIPAAVAGYLGKARLTAEFSAVTAACLFVRRADFIAIGGFDVELAVAYNDIDLCLKLRQNGLKVVCDHDITLIHKESRTRGYDTDGARAERLRRDAEQLRARWGDQLRDDPYYSPNLSLETSNFELAWPPRVPMPWLSVPSAH